MKPFALLALLVMPTAFASITPTWKTRVPAGDGSVYFTEPRLEYEGSAYALPFSTTFQGGGWENFSPHGFCRLAVGPESESSWDTTAVERVFGEVAVIAIDAQGQFLKRGTLRDDFVSGAIRCTGAAPADRGNFRFVSETLPNGDVRITSESTFTLPFTLEPLAYYGAPAIVDYARPQTMKLILSEMTASATCAAAGYPNLVRTEPGGTSGSDETGVFLYLMERGQVRAFLDRRRSLEDRIAVVCRR